MLFNLALPLFLLASLPPALGQSSSASHFGPSASLPGQPLSSTGTPISSANASSSAGPSLTSSAQLPSLSGYSSCVSQCFDMAVAATGCDSVADVNCFCSSANVTSFENELVDCMSAQCPSSIAAAEGLSQKFCNVASSSASLSFPAPSLTSSLSSSIPTSSASSTAPVTSPAPSSHSGSPTSSVSSTTSGSSSAKQILRLDYILAMALMTITLRWVV